MCVCQQFGSKVLQRIVTGCSVGFALMLAGCGETSRPVVTPVAVTGPAPQPQSYAVVTTSAGANFARAGECFRRLRGYSADPGLAWALIRWR